MTDALVGPGEGPTRAGVHRPQPVRDGSWGSCEERTRLSQSPATPTVSKSSATEPSSKTALMARASSGAIGRTVS